MKRDHAAFFGRLLVFQLDNLEAEQLYQVWVTARQLQDASAGLRLVTQVEAAHRPLDQLERVFFGKIADLYDLHVDQVASPLAELIERV